MGQTGLQRLPQKRETDIRTRIFLAAAVVLPLAVLGLSRAAAEPWPLTDADKKAFAWFDGIRLPSCAGKAYVRVRWVKDGASTEAPRASDVWSVDGFVVDEREGMMTLLDGDLWPRKVSRKPSPGWTGTVTTLDLRRVAKLALGRLRSIKSDPGAVEAMDVMYPGVRLRFGDEAQSLALARHCAENGLEQEAHDLLAAARALPPLADAGADAMFLGTVAEQLAESVIWRILFDFADADIPRVRLLERLKGWETSFPDSDHWTRVEAPLEVLPGMIKEETAHKPIAAADFKMLAPAEQATVLIWRLRDQSGDVYRGQDGAVSIDLGAEDSPANQLIALGLEAAPALVEAINDKRFTRAVLFIQDDSLRRLVVARVGDFARVILEAIADKAFWEVPENEPSMWQEDVADRVQRRCRRWLERAKPAKPAKETK